MILKSSLFIGFVGILGTAGCGGDVRPPPAPVAVDAGDPPADVVQPDARVIPTGPLIVNEILAKNDGVNLDQELETDDWIELINVSEESVELGAFSLTDGSGTTATLPARSLAPGQLMLLWADGQLDQGDDHLPFELSAERGDSLELRRGETLSDNVTFGPMPPNVSLARLPDGSGELMNCRYATPGRLNAGGCQPPDPPSIIDDTTFTHVDPRDDLTTPPGPLALSEIALADGGFVEILNVSQADVALGTHSLWLAPHGPGVSWPGPGAGQPITLPTMSLGPGERTTVDVTTAHLFDLQIDPNFEGVLTLFDDTGAVSDRADFMAWPIGATLTRLPDSHGAFRFCTDRTAGATNACAPLASRPVGDRLRHLRTPGDFAALSRGGSALGIASVKFVLDMLAGGVVHLLSAEQWALHYTFIREQIYGEPPLDRCDPIERQAFNAGWGAFSRTEYFQVSGRRFLLGTLAHHSGAGLHTVEYALGDVITGAQMRDGFFAAVAHTLDPTPWALRPQDDTQVTRAQLVEGTLPIIGPNAPFQGVTYQPLTEGVGYGTLRFIPADQLGTASLGQDVIVVTDAVPNDIPFVGGLITEAFQTPLAHVNVLSQNRGTPNIGLRGARDDSRIAPFLDQLVRLEVTADGFTISPASPGEATAFWEAQRPSTPLIAPRVDATVRNLVSLDEAGFVDLPTIGAKAAQLAELGAIVNEHGTCGALPLPTPRDAFAVPVAHYLDHFATSGARDRLADLRADPLFNADATLRALALTEVRNMMRTHPVNPTLLLDVERLVEQRFGNDRVRFRSSSNTEDLPGFNGAGLYTSSSAAIGDPARKVEDALRTAWASLWNARAYDEREHANIDHDHVAMGVLVHPAFISEEANIVAVSRNVLDPVRGDIYYLNAQFGEASVTNPAPGVSTESLIYCWPPRSPSISYQTRSSLLPGDVLTATEVAEIACALGAIHDHFRPILDPTATNPRFTMEIEAKLIGPDHALMIKQARPHEIHGVDVAGDCREL